MITVLKEFKYQGQTAYYTVQNSNGEEANIRPSQLEDFCVLRHFSNAEYKNGKLVPKGDGFDVSTDMLPAEQRKEKLIGFVNMLMSASIRVSAIERSRNARCDADSFALEAMGHVGKIRIMPGTEGFNRRIIDMLHFANAEIADCRCIHPSYGYSESYLGWKPSCSRYVNDLPKDYYFSIEDRPYYTPDWIKRTGVSEFDVRYIVRVNGDVNGVAAIGNGNKILATALFQMK